MQDVVAVTSLSLCGTGRFLLMPMMSSSSSSNNGADSIPSNITPRTAAQFGSILEKM